MRLVTSLTLVGLFSFAATLSACRGCERRGGPAPTPATSASVASEASSAAASASGHLAVKREPPLELAATNGGVALGAALYRGPASADAVVVLLHRWAGSRAEWAPLLERFDAAGRPAHVLAVDLRGHGASTARVAEKGASAKQLAFHSLAPADYAAMSDDVRAALAALDRAVPGVARVVLVGSDLGATLAARVGGAEPRTTAIAAVSPGASLHGLDLYRAFAAVRRSAVFLAAAEGDTVSAEPMGGLAAMAPAASVHRYPGDAHAAEALGGAQPAMWSDVAVWLTDVALVAPVPASPASASASASASAPAPQPSSTPAR